MSHETRIHWVLIYDIIFLDQKTYCAECREPCHGATYDPAISFAQLSTSSLTSLRAKGSSDLTEKLKAGLEAKQKTEPSIYLTDLYLLDELQTALTDILDFIDASIYQPGQSIIVNVEEAMTIFLNRYALADLSLAIQGSLIRGYLKYYRDRYETLHLATSDIVTALRTDIYVTGNYLKSSADFEVSVAESISQLSSVLLTSLHTYRTLLPESAHDHTVHPLSIFGKQEAQCQGIFTAVEETLELILNSIEPVLNDSTNPTLIDTLLATMPTYAGDFFARASSVQSCLQIYVEAVKAAYFWRKENQQLLQAELNTLLLANGQESIEERLNFEAYYSFIGEYKIEVAQAFKDFKNGLVKKSDLISLFNFENIQKVSNLIEQFTVRAEEDLIVHSSDIVANVEYTVIGFYTELSEHMLSLSCIFDPADYLEAVRSMTIWRGPVGSVEDPSHPSHTVDRIRVTDLEEFLHTQFAETVTDIVKGYTEPLYQTLKGFQNDLLIKRNILDTALKEISASFDTYAQELMIDQDFVRFVIYRN